MAPSATAAHELHKGAGCMSDTIAHYAYFWKFYHEAVEKLEQANTKNDKKYWKEQVEKYQGHLPNEKTLLLVDEAGMVGVGGADGHIAGGWDALIRIVNLTGCKLMVVGDDHQFKPVEAGDVFRKVIEMMRAIDKNFFELTEIQRQRFPWMKEASHHLAELRTGEALGMYESQGHVQEYETNADIYQVMAHKYLCNIIRAPDSQNLVLAYTNEEVWGLNMAIRKILKENSLLEKEDLITRGKRIEQTADDSSIDEPNRFEEELREEGRTVNQATNTSADESPQEATSEVGYTIGDKIVFTLNDRGFWTNFKSPDPHFFVRNGTVGTIESIKSCRVEDRDTKEMHSTYKIVVCVDDEVKSPSKTGASKVSFYLNEYSSFQHGYAMTTHKSQGGTADGSLVKVSRYMDAYALYVALTRHREDMSLYYSKKDFADFQDLLKTVGKLSVKDLAVDYSVLEENQEYWVNVQDYKALGYELSSIRAFGRSADKADKAEQERIWTNYDCVKQERKILARYILEEWDTHGNFVRQAGFTRESLEIAADLKKRPLRRLEEQAQMIVKQYANVAIETRQAWGYIRKTHPGSRAKTHPEWETFVALRDCRGELATQIMQNPILYRPFLKQASKTIKEEGSFQKFGYGMHVVKAQAEAHQSQTRLSKMIQQELLKDTSDPILQERLIVLLNYVEARDISASLWKDLKPKLKHAEGTLLSEGYCKDIADFTESRMARDQRALTIINSWEEYHPLIQKIGMKLTFEQLIDQKEQSVRDNLFKTYTTSQNQLKKLQAAFELKMLMDEEAAEGKKVTVAQVYHQGLQPKDITHHALKYEKLKLIESLTNEDEHQFLMGLTEYDDHCYEANKIYIRCLNDIKERSAQTGEELKPWDSLLWPDYQQAISQRNVSAFVVSNKPDFLESLSLANQKGWSVDGETILTHAQEGYRHQVILKYIELAKDTTTESEMVKAKLAVHLTQMIQDDHAEGHKKTVIALYQANVNPKDIFIEAKDFRDFRVLRDLEFEEDRHIYATVYAYKVKSNIANGIYRQCLQDRDESNIKVIENLRYNDYLAAIGECNETATALLALNDWEKCLSIAEQLEVTLDEDKLLNQSRDYQRQILLRQYLATNSTLVKCLIARELKDHMIEDQKDQARVGSSKVTVADLYRHNILPQDIQTQAKQFDRMMVYTHLTDFTEREIYSFLERYDDLMVQSKVHYRECCQEAEEQKTPKEETTSYPLFQEAFKERLQLASVIQQTTKSSLIAIMAEDMGISLHTLNKDSRAYDMESIGMAKNDISTADPNAIELAANAFITLSEQYEKTHWKDPKRKEIRESLDKIVSNHWRDDAFVSKIENSGSKVAASSIKIEIHIQEVELSHSRHQLDR
jgi:hypothetical protein